MAGACGGPKIAPDPIGALDLPTMAMLAVLTVIEVLESLNLAAKVWLAIVGVFFIFRPDVIIAEV